MHSRRTVPGCLVNAERLQAFAALGGRIFDKVPLAQRNNLFSSRSARGRCALFENDVNFIIAVRGSCNRQRQT
jgi:hypothetical protein